MPILIIIGGIVVFGLVIAISHNRFHQMGNTEIEAIFQHDTNQAVTTFSYDDLEHLPEPVQKYLKRSLKAGQPYANRVRLKQSGGMRLSPDQPWKPFTAEQYFNVNPPAFIWRAKLQFLPLIWVSARDKYVHQFGNMLIKILTTLPVADAKGPKVTSAALIRFVAEMIWFPTALVNANYLQWEAVNATSAIAKVNDDGVEATVTFVFDEVGDIIKVSSDRYLNADDEYPTKWCGRIRQYGEFNGVRIPSKVEVGWELETGYFAYWRGNITDIEFNVGTRY